MRQLSLWMIAIAALSIVMSLTVGPRIARADAQPPSRAANLTETAALHELGQRCEKQGVQVGQTLADAAVFTLDGRAVGLASMWRDRPTVIVTVCMSSPAARQESLRLKALVDEFDPEARLVLLYTVEAHPHGEGSPCSPGREWPLRENDDHQVRVAQPATLEERLQLARQMDRRLDSPGLMLVDAMDNHAWRMLGSGPNLAALVDTDGTAVAKQGWLDVQAMARAVDHLLNRRAARAAEAYDVGKQARGRMDEFIAALSAHGRGAVDDFLAADARAWIDQRSGAGEPILSDPRRAWETALNAAFVVEDARIEADKVVIVASEIDDFARLIEAPAQRSVNTYWFDASGRITGVLRQPLPARPSWRECFSPALNWVRQHHPDDLQAIYPNERLALTAASARRWRELLLEWREATGRRSSSE
jgi:hypothetical protein